MPFTTNIFSFSRGLHLRVDMAIFKFHWKNHMLINLQDVQLLLHVCLYIPHVAIIAHVSLPSSSEESAVTPAEAGLAD